MESTSDWLNERSGLVGWRRRRERLWLFPRRKKADPAPSTEATPSAEPRPEDPPYRQIVTEEDGA